MRKHLFVTLLLACGMPLTGNFAAFAAPEPQSQSQSVVTITGTVLDENNEPVIGASVVQKGVQGNAAATDFDGNFTLRVPAGSMLRISYVGYKPVEMAAKQGMMVYMQPTTEQLNELVAIGYGTQKKANLTGAVATVDVARTMDSRPVQDVTKALQGAVPGLTITTLSGNISEDATIRVRGLGTLSNNQESNPLIVVDGVPVDNLNFVNPEDIQDISVLKDASSAAVYGSRASFGVILITTKSASTKDHVSVSYNNNFAWSQATILPHFANTVDQIEQSLASAYAGAGSLTTEVGGLNYADLLPYAQAWQTQHGGKPYTDYRELKPFQSWDNVGDYVVLPNGQWLRYAEWDINKLLYNNAVPSQKHNVTLEGTSGKTQYRLSFGYDAKQGALKYNPEKMHRYMVNANITTQVFSWLKAGARINFTQREYTEPNLSRNSYQYFWRWPSFFETYGYVYNENGEQVGFRNDISNRTLAHTDKTVSRQTRLQGWLQAKIIEGLTLQADFTYDIRTSRTKAAYTPYTVYNTWSADAFTDYTNVMQPATFARYEDTDNDMWTMNVFGTYEKTFNNDHNLKVMLGASAEQQEIDYVLALKRGLIDYNLPNFALTDGGNGNYNITGSNNDRATAGFFGRINYDYKGIYLLEVNGRYDGSSRFPAHDQWAFFPSFSAGYRFSEESYFEPLKSWWSNGKIRASYGELGNEAVGDYLFLSTISRIASDKVTWLADAQGTKITEMSIPSLVSKDLTWERIGTTDVGVDLGFFNNALNVNFDWYSRETRDMLAYGQELPQVLGATAPLTNSGRMRTNGWEIQLGWNHSFGDADVFVTANIGDARTKITDWVNTDKIYQSIPGNFDRGRYYEGQYVGDIWGFEFDRYFEESDFTGKDGRQWIYAPGIADQTPLQTNSAFIYGPGDVKFKDLNGDGVINAGDENMRDENGELIPIMSVKNHGDAKVIGNMLPRYEYSFRLGGAWKGFDLDLFFQGVGKRSMWFCGSTVIPFAQTNTGIFEHQLDANQYIFDDNHQIVGYEINQDNLYPNVFATAFGFSGTYNQIFGQGRYNFYPSNRYLTDMSYLRLKNVTFGYTIPASITQKAYIQKARIYFSAENLAFLHNGAGKFKLDPELATGDGGQSSANGIATFGRTAPMMRTFSFGIQVTI